jgi:hypothetical protein
MVRIGEVLREKAQRRELAGDRRAGRWSRRQARERQYISIRGNWPRLLLFGVVPFVAAPAMLLIPSSLRWFAGGALIASTGWVVALHVILVTGTASQMSGEFAERCTASELRRLRRRGWRTVNTVRLRHGTSDIDHVALGPGGLFAFETKWIGSSCSTQKMLDERVRNAVAQVTETETRLRLMFGKDVPENARKRVVVLWGPGSETWEQPASIDDVTVLKGRDIRRWLDRRPTDVLTQAAVERCWAKLVNTVERRDQNIAEREGAEPRALGNHVARLLGLALATGFGFAMVVESFSFKPHGLAALAFCAVPVCACTAALRLRRLVPFNLGWIAGAACATGLILLAVVLTAS